MAYCITHELENVAWAGEFLGCIITSCPPPEVGLTFEEVSQLVPPSEDELIQMDMNAEVLEQDFLSGGADMKELESYDKVILNLFDRFYDEQN